jgi:hypothetical protein
MIAATAPLKTKTPTKVERLFWRASVELVATKLTDDLNTYIMNLSNDKA